MLQRPRKHYDNTLPHTFVSYLELRKLDDALVGAQDPDGHVPCAPGASTQQPGELSLAEASVVKGIEAAQEVKDGGPLGRRVSLDGRNAEGVCYICIKLATMNAVKRATHQPCFEWKQCYRTGQRWGHKYCTRRPRCRPNHLE